MPPVDFRDSLADGARFRRVRLDASGRWGGARRGRRAVRRELALFLVRFWLALPARIRDARVRYRPVTGQRAEPDPLDRDHGVPAGVDPDPAGRVFPDLPYRDLEPDGLGCSALQWPRSEVLRQHCPDLRRQAAPNEKVWSWLQWPFSERERKDDSCGREQRAILRYWRSQPAQGKGEASRRGRFSDP